MILQLRRRLTWIGLAARVLWKNRDWGTTKLALQIAFSRPKTLASISSSFEQIAEALAEAE